MPGFSPRSTMLAVLTTHGTDALAISRRDRLAVFENGDRLAVFENGACYRAKGVQCFARRRVRRLIQRVQRFVRKRARHSGRYPWPSRIAKRWAISSALSSGPSATRPDSNSRRYPAGKRIVSQNPTNCRAVTVRVTATLNRDGPASGWSRGVLPISLLRPLEELLYGQ